MYNQDLTNADDYGVVYDIVSTERRRSADLFHRIGDLGLRQFPTQMHQNIFYDVSVANSPTYPVMEGLHQSKSISKAEARTWKFLSVISEYVVAGSCIAEH